MDKPHIAIRCTNALAMLALGVTLAINKGSMVPFFLCAGIACYTMVKG